MQIVIQDDLIVHQMDFETAYLKVSSDSSIYVEQLKCFVQIDKNGKKKIVKLKKFLYKLKQTGRNWNNLLHKFLIDQNFEQSSNDYCVYRKNL